MPIVITSRVPFQLLPFPQPPTATAVGQAFDAVAAVRVDAAAGVATASGTAHDALVTSSGRGGLVVGVDQPDATNTGILPGSTLIDVTGADLTYSTAGQTISNRNFLVDVFVNAANVTFQNCRFRGGNATPGNGQGLVEIKTAACVNVQFIDCEFYPQFPHWDWDSAVVGHDFTLLRCHIHHTTDGINVFNLNKPNGDWASVGFASTPKPYQTNVLIQQCLIEKLAYWSAAANGVVHPSDVATHNDGIQHQGGLGTRIIGNTIRGEYARNYAHWWRTPYPTGNTTVEPYAGVALQSLPAGNPTYGGPFQSLNSNTIPDRATGAESNGRYNVGGVGSLSTLLIGDETTTGPSGNLVIEDNWLYGGDFCVNGGGAVNRDYPTGPPQTYTMVFRRNKFDYASGQPSRTTQTTTTQTINFQQGEDSWQGFVTAPTTGPDANTYLGGEPVTVRT